ncbi:uncharacterized protein EV420DRAFT_1712690 [Desarmillaria tabescens]|uniref:F-box domain-containing protein n=1 Tax=Armillaria tabescens TaxID=1929756 RepID=A0AA39JRY4_ARMTA|nr:uncharacterized protein EV420DRAFT_1712690 [Desarmillaria tabescens]KAK0447816.1 hypothetical protein EV420DRAFT_1712690 [Desarmillaria tabescens]
MQSFHVPLEEILAKYDWIPTFTHPPDIASLLRTNEAPSPSQSARLKASLADMTTRTPISELQSDLDLLRNAVVSLESRMTRLQTLKKDYETALSPIRHIPSEILAEILRRSWKAYGSIELPLGRYHSLGTLDVFTIQEGPWPLGQVCSSWRHVIETLCPELWATMDLGSQCSRGRRPIKDAAVEILRVVLERSRNHPLDFRLYFYDLEVDVKAMDQCFDLMITHSKRWRDVSMNIPPHLLPRLSPIRGKIDLLTDMVLACYTGSKPEDLDIRAFEIAPKLETLYMYGIHPDVSIRFPVINLVSFSDARPFGGDRLTPKYVDIVKAAPRLYSFSYNDYGANLMSTSLSFPCVMSPSIEELSVSSPSYGLPFGEELIKCPVDALGALHQMLLQSQCSLSRLHLIDAILDDNLVNIIQLMPSLQQFVIEVNEWEDEYDPIMRSLVTKMSEIRLLDGSLQHCVVPSLQELEVSLSDIDDTYVSFLDSAFVDMVASRLHGPSDALRLTSLRLSMSGCRWAHDLDEVDEDALKNLKHEGLELTYDLYDAAMSD